MTDFEKLAITTLAGLGTDRGNALAMEIQRGLDRRNQSEQQQREAFAELFAGEEQRFAEMLPYLRPATAADYHAWLLVHLAKGGHLTHTYDRPFNPRRWYVATEPFVVRALHGAHAISVIVPAGIAVTADSPGQPLT